MAAPTGIRATVFDDFVENYDDACGRGLSLSGESRDYFARGRILRTKHSCAARPVHRVLDFGCGLGHSTPYFLEAFPDASIVGVDSSARAIEAARQRYGSDRVAFTTSTDAIEPETIDVAYSNGTFHHIDPADRHAVVRSIVATLAPDGLFVLWENNPWNPGTRLVMRRIPFDRDARTLSYREATRMLVAAGLPVKHVSSHFYFPSWLSPLRQLEARLERLPLGAQYCVIGVKPTPKPAPER